MTKEEVKNRDKVVADQIKFLKKENEELAVIVRNLELQIKHTRYTAELDSINLAIQEAQTKEKPKVDKPKKEKK